MYLFGYMTKGSFLNMSSKTNSTNNLDFKIQITYDKINTKYNRLYEQTTNIILFILASAVAYSILYIGYALDRTTDLTIVINKLITPIIFTIIAPLIIVTILITLLILTGINLHKFLKEENLICG